MCDENPHEDDQAENKRYDHDEGQFIDEISSISILDGFIIIFIRFIAADLIGFPSHFFFAGLNPP